MNEDLVAGRWRDIRNSLKEKWGGLTEGELDRIHDNWKELEGIVRDKYGISNLSARQVVSDFESTIKVNLDRKSTM